MTEQEFYAAVEKKHRVGKERVRRIVAKLRKPPPTRKELRQLLALTESWLKFYNANYAMHNRGGRSAKSL